MISNKKFFNKKIAKNKNSKMLMVLTYKNSEIWKYDNTIKIPLLLLSTMSYEMNHEIINELYIDICILDLIWICK